MIRLKEPPITDSEKKIYMECANSFEKEKTYTQIALSYIDKVEEYSKNYKRYVPFNVKNFHHIEMGKEHKEIIEKLYTQKFVPKDSVGNKYYNIIKGNAGGRCPICGDGKVANLDHFLPKSKYPLLCVTPINLVPMCRDCNMGKGAKFSPDYYKQPFNPYLDVMKDEWVSCKVEFYIDSVCITYSNGYCKEKNSNIWEKYQTHMDIHKLDKTFSSRAISELENVKGIYRKQLQQTNKEEVKSSLNEIKECAEKIDKNSWRTALYRALINEIYEFCKWLKINNELS